MPSNTTTTKIPPGFVIGILIALIWAGFALRLKFLLGRLFYIDEYFSMLSALMTLQKGAPILPSGFFDDHGLILSYLSAASMLMMGGFSETAVRWPSLLIGTLTIPVSYMIARRLFFSNVAGLIAALTFVFERTSILWDGRIRMYALAYLMIMLAAYFIYQGAIKNPGSKYRLLFVICAVGSLWSHYVTIFALAAMVLTALAMALFIPAINSSWLWKKSLVFEALIAIAAMGPVFWVLSQSFLGNNLAIENPSHNAGTLLGLGYLSGYLNISLDWQNIAKFVPYFQREANHFLVIFAIIAFFYAGFQLFQRRAKFQDFAAIFLASIIPLTILIISTFADDSWHDRRYLYILSMPFLILLAAYGFINVGQTLENLYLKLQSKKQKPHWLIKVGALGLIFVSVWAYWGNTILNIISPSSTGGYGAAFTFIKEHWQANDQTITWHPAACYVYLEHCNFYANQHTPKLAYKNGQWVDTFIGSRYIADANMLNQVLSTGQRTWFVVDMDRFYGHFDDIMRQQILNQMYLVRSADAIFVFQSREGLHPVAESPSATLRGDFGAIVLEGYHADFTQVETRQDIPLTTFWRPINTFPGKNIKAFIHLRNQANETVAQADHKLFGVHDNILALRDEWNLMHLQNRWLRDGTALSVPQNLPSGLYTLYLGLYDPDTLERYPLYNDTSGENAIRLTSITIP